MANSSQEGHDRQPQYQCYGCAGKGQVVQPVVVVDPVTGDISTREEAGTCPHCSGSGWM
jgi:hypothetical protein